MVVEFVVAGIVSTSAVGLWVSECYRSRRWKQRYNHAEKCYAEEQRQTFRNKDTIENLIRSNKEFEIGYDVELMLRKSRKDIVNFKYKYGKSDIVEVWERVHKNLERCWESSTSNSNGNYVRRELRELQIEVMDEKIHRIESERTQREQEHERKRDEQATPYNINTKVWLDALGLHSDVSDIRTIKKHYRNLMKRYHPDNKDTGSVEKSQELNEAMEHLERKFG